MFRQKKPPNICNSDVIRTRRFELLDDTGQIKAFLAMIDDEAVFATKEVCDQSKSVLAKNLEQKSPSKKTGTRNESEWA